jgi:hypothetical protein
MLSPDQSQNHSRIYSLAQKLLLSETLKVIAKNFLPLIYNPSSILNSKEDDKGKLPAFNGFIGAGYRAY